jgi:hypothetical protein
MEDRPVRVLATPGKRVDVKALGFECPVFLGE